MPKILIIDEVHDSIHQLFDNTDFELAYYPNITREEVINIDEQFDGLISRSKTTVDEELLQSQKLLRFVARPGAGLDLFDLDYLAARDIQVISAPEGNRDILGEHVLGMLLSISNNLRKSDLEVRDGVWDRAGNRGFEINGKVVAILGYGHMGSAFAQKLSGFGCEVIAYDKYKKGYSDQFVREADMAEVFERADIYSLHVPLTDETRGLVDAAYLQNFKKNIVLLNAARGPIVPLVDLNKMLDSGQVKYAGLDVLENENIEQLSPNQQRNFDQLIKRENVLLSPHVGGWSFESYYKMNKIIVDKIKKIEW